MLRDFEDLKPGDTVIQNGANSACGQVTSQLILLIFKYIQYGVYFLGCFPTVSSPQIEQRWDCSKSARYSSTNRIFEKSRSH